MSSMGSPKLCNSCFIFYFFLNPNNILIMYYCIFSPKKMRSLLTFKENPLLRIWLNRHEKTDNARTVIFIYFHYLAIENVLNTL